MYCFCSYLHGLSLLENIKIWTWLMKLKTLSKLTYPTWNTEVIISICWWTKGWTNEQMVVSLFYLVLLGRLTASDSYRREILLLDYRSPCYGPLALLRLLPLRHWLLETLSRDFVPTVPYVLHVRGRNIRGLSRGSASRFFSCLSQEEARLEVLHPQPRNHTLSLQQRKRTQPLPPFILPVLHLVRSDLT